MHGIFSGKNFGVISEFLKDFLNAYMEQFWKKSMIDCLNENLEKITRGIARAANKSQQELFKQALIFFHKIFVEMTREISGGFFWHKIPKESMGSLSKEKKNRIS